MSIGHISFLDSCKWTWGQKAYYSESRTGRKPQARPTHRKIAWGGQISKMGISEEARGHA